MIVERDAIARAQQLPPLRALNADELASIGLRCAYLAFRAICLVTRTEPRYRAPGRGEGGPANVARPIAHYRIRLAPRGPIEGSG